MNPLMQIVKTEILARETLNEKIFFDHALLEAIKNYNSETAPQRKAQLFFKALTPIWELYSKQSYINLFWKFIKLETGLETYSSDYSSHYNHVINEFLFGYCILTNSLVIKKKYNFKKGRKKPESDFGKLLFSWMAASLFHDIGYDIENAPEEEAFREFQNEFWDFMTPREITTSPLQLNVSGRGRELLEDYIYDELKKYISKEISSYGKFEKLFIRKVETRPDWVRYDHGIISALKYLLELDELEKKEEGDYLYWPPNKYAAMAMALHNFRYKNCKLKISSSNEETLISYLLIICDEIQEWDRGREDIQDIDVSSGKSEEIKKNTELTGLIFREDYAFISLNHRLKQPTLRKKFEEELDERIIKLMKDYPIRIFIPNEHYYRFVNVEDGIKPIRKDLLFWESKTWNSNKHITTPENAPYMSS